MKELALTLPKTRDPFYRRLAEALRSAIFEGRLRPGDALPSSRELAQRFGIHRHTVMNALSELQAEGWLTSVEKRHYLVNETLPTTFLRAKQSRRAVPVVSKASFEFARRVEIEDFTPPSRFKHSFPSGFPDFRLFPMKEFKSCLYDALSSKNVLAYGSPSGHPRLIAQIEMYLRRMRGVSNKEIIVTNGSQEAIYILAQLFLAPGDNVAVEALAYPPALEALRAAGAKTIPIAIDDEGLKVDELARIVKTRRIKMIYLTPLHQYPTTVTLSAPRRLALYELAYKNNILILEDDYDHEFHYVSEPSAPLANFDPAGIVLYVSTFSKILFPSARVGFMAVPREVALQGAKLKRIVSRQNEQILQDAIARWMEGGGFERHLRKMRRTYEERRDEMVRSLARLQRQRSDIGWNVPDGGMALWLDINRDSKTFEALARRNGILVNPESRFRVDRAQGRHLRLGFSGKTPEENDAALEALFRLF